MADTKIMRTRPDGLLEPATPTPGDLSARLREVLSFYANKANYDSPESNCGNYYLASEADKDKGEKAREAIAALSALPAAGGLRCTDPDNCRRCSEDASTPHAGIPRDSSAYTTPQPSAAEGAVPFSAKWLDDNGQEATMEWRAGWDACRVEYPRTAPPAKAIPSEDFLPMPACLRRDVDDYGTPDAAVGAQGEFAPTGNPQECETMAEAALLSERALWQDDEGVRWVPEACWQRALTEIERLEAAHAPPATTSAEEGNRG